MTSQNVEGALAERWNAVSAAPSLWTDPAADPRFAPVGELRVARRTAAR